MWTNIDERLINSYVVVVMAGRRTLESCPEKYRAEIEIRIAEKTIAALEPKIEPTVE